MKKTFPDSVRKNLKHSISYAINFTRKLLKEKKSEFVCESVIQLIRDIYLFKKGKNLEESVIGGAEELSLGFTELEKNTIKLIEKSMRKEEYYKETCGYINLDLLNSILLKIEKYLYE